MSIKNNYPNPLVSALMDHQESIEAFTDIQSGQLIKSILRYLNGLNIPVQDPKVKECFELIKPALSEYVNPSKNYSDGEC